MFWASIIFHLFLWCTHHHLPLLPILQNAIIIISKIKSFYTVFSPEFRNFSISSFSIPSFLPTLKCVFACLSPFASMLQIHKSTINFTKIAKGFCERERNKRTNRAKKCAAECWKNFPRPTRVVCEYPQHSSLCLELIGDSCVGLLNVLFTQKAVTWKVFRSIELSWAKEGSSKEVVTKCGHYYPFT